ncbi:MAG: hypothetical protein E7265_05745 [Lachnospiraceae bacterium]|nr:hypothetical protein [Lachnospiraceae bacterium]
MKALLPLFPFSNIKRGSIVGLIVAIVIYVVIAAVLGVVLSLVAGMPIINWVAGIISTLIWIYEVVGIVLAILKFIK